MTWVKLDDGLTDNAKVADLSDTAFRTYITALCFCSRNLTDGQLTAAQLRKVLVSEGDAEELTRAFLFEAREGGGAILHDFLHYQPSRAQVQARREAVAERVQKHRGQLQPDRNCNAVTSELQAHIKLDPVTLLPSPPLPSDPLPSNPIQEPEQDGGAARSAKPRSNTTIIEKPEAMTEGWTPPENARTAAQAKFECTEADINRTLPEFRYYWVSGKGAGKKRTPKGWVQTWMNRMTQMAKTGELYVVRGSANGTSGSRELRPHEERNVERILRQVKLGT